MPEEDFEAIGKTREAGRQFVRTREDFPIQFQLLNREEVETLKPQFQSLRTAEREAESDPFAEDGRLEAFAAQGASRAQLALHQQTLRMLRALDRKLDRVLSALAGRGTGARPGLEEARCVDLSGSGCRFLCQWPLSKGWFVKVILPLPPVHPFTVAALAEVVLVRKDASDKSGKTYDVAVSFTAIHEQDQEEIIAYGFKRQRNLAREQAGGPPAP